MIALNITTARRGRLWATTYWKCLIDSLFAGGAKTDPRSQFSDLASLPDLIREQNGRFFPVPGMASSECDDTARRMIRIDRGPVGRIAISEFDTFPDTAAWDDVEVPWFGTIGSREPEKQSQENRQRIAGFLDASDACGLSLGFTLSTARRDRDLDNLADAIMPEFSNRFRNLKRLTLFKLPPKAGDTEILHIAATNPGE